MGAAYSGCSAWGGPAGKKPHPCTPKCSVLSPKSIPRAAGLEVSRCPPGAWGMGCMRSDAPLDLGTGQQELLGSGSSQFGNHPTSPPPLRIPGDKPVMLRAAQALP